MTSIKKADILEHIAAGVVVSDGAGYIITVNAAAERILGIPRQRILGHPLECLADYTTPDPDTNWSLIARSGCPLQTVCTSKNTIVHINATPILTPEGEQAGIVTVLRDITEETQAERARSEFITAISHELRTPITAIQGYAEALSSGLAGVISAAQAELLDIIRDDALRTVSLVENLTAVSQIEKGFLKLEYGETDLHLLIGDVVRSFRSQLEARQLNVDLQIDEDLPLIEADPARVRQILDNLISNTIKFTYPGGDITVGAKSLGRAQERLPSHCAIWVSDTGIGILPEEQSRIWKRFYQPTASPTAQAGGVGVGLSIVKSLVEAHNGRVWVESAPGVGSTFTILLPIKREDVTRDV